MAMMGLREVLIYAENDHKSVSIVAGTATVSGKVLRVNPLIVEASDGSGVMVLDFDAIQAVTITDASGEEVIEACKPQKETKFTGTRRF